VLVCTDPVLREHGRLGAASRESEQLGARVPRIARRCAAASPATTRLARSALPERAEVCVQGARLDEDIYVGSLSQTLADYQAATARRQVPPPSELELIKWRGRLERARDVLEDVNRLQKRGSRSVGKLLDKPVGGPATACSPST